MTGRLLAVLFAVATVPAVFLLARSLFDETVGLVAAALALLSPVAIAHAQIVRTDSPATFFTVLGLWLAVRVAKHPGWRNQLAAGACIGLGVASRYFVVTLVPVLLVASVLAFTRERAGRAYTKRHAIGAVVGAAAALVTFAMATPFALLDAGTVVESLRIEARSTALGADGLSRPENLAWYLVHAIPGAIGWPQFVAALAGAALALRRPFGERVLLPIAVLVFLAGISLSALHWQRWTIPILPLLAVLAASAAVHAARRMAGRRWLPPLVAAGALGLAAVPLHGAVLDAIGRAGPSTRLVAREWIAGHVPAGSRIQAEWYTAPLPHGRFDARFIYALGSHRLAYYEAAGTEYAVVSSAQYDRFLAEPTRYPGAVRLYTQLAATADLVAEFTPARTRAGPTIRVYRLRGGRGGT